MPVLCPTALRVDESYTRDYILIANFVAMLLIPFLLITILNFRLFKTIKVCFVKPTASETYKFWEILQTILVHLSLVLGKSISQFFGKCNVCPHGGIFANLVEVCTSPLLCFCCVGSLLFFFPHLPPSSNLFTSAFNPN